MLALTQAFLQIVLRRLGPEDLPDSGFLLGVTLASYLLAQLPVAALLFGWSAVALQAIAVNSLLLAGFFWTLLQLTGRAHRYRQTLTALLGTGTLLMLPQWPLAWWWKMASGTGEPPVGPAAGLLAIVLWSLIVQAHVTSRALSSHFSLGLVVAIAYVFVSYQIAGQVGPAPR